ncbi:hypothetical protein QJS04_geneDACA017180 [Acorus gramineus]|uniref:Uncharacterized protein n=1 Tax=Acorus gramineus TaxID=55184 RepID=A0AAV9BL74_ACOGR|nr:hypothetical protein QJS04_geneDACA017180 [Acorus gramineus]
MYQDVVEVDDLNKLFDCSKIQTYKNNGKRAVYLNPKVQSRPSKSNGGTGGSGGGGGGPQCVVCKIRITESTNLFCSIACKISEEGVNNNDSSPTSHLEAEEAFPPPSSSSLSQERGENSMDGSDEGTGRPKKRIRRRKGVPHRSPLF